MIIMTIKMIVYKTHKNAATHDDGNDCNNECGGTSENDDCGVCGGNNSYCTD